MQLKNPSQILMNFLRVKMTELVRSGLSTRQTADTETFNGDAAETEFTITRTDVLAIGEVSISAVTQKPYVDYQIDLDNRKIIFASAPATGTNNVSITYYYGDESWIFESENRMTLEDQAYPFININEITESSVPQGASEDDTYDTITFQIDVISFKNSFCTIDSLEKEGPDVSDYLARRVLYHCLKNWRYDLSARLFDPIKINKYPAPFNEPENTFRQIIELKYNMFNVGD